MAQLSREDEVIFLLLEEKKNFDRYYGLALVMSTDESLKRLYNLLNEGEQKELCLACILLRKESAKRTLDFFSEIN